MEILSDEQSLFVQGAFTEQSRHVTMFQLAEKEGNDICDPF
jgi:hypothetical protein